MFRNQDLTLEQQYALSDHWGVVSTDRGSYLELVLMFVQRDRDPNQVDPRHVTVLGRNE